MPQEDTRTIRLDNGNIITTIEPIADVSYDTPLLYCSSSDSEVNINRNGRVYTRESIENIELPSGQVLSEIHDRLISTSTHASNSDVNNNELTREFLDRLIESVNAASNSYNNCYFYNCNSNTNSKPIIHSWNYKPEYKKHYIDNEDRTTTLLLGAEIEVDEGGENEDNAKEVLNIMNGDNKEEYIYCVHDGSLHNGLEFPTMPCSLEFHKTLKYKEMFKYLDEHGYIAHDSDKAGLHIHINRDFFGDKYNQDKCIKKLIFIVEKFYKEISILGRRSCRYSQFIGYNGEKCNVIYKKHINRYGQKYQAVNLQHEDTIELRFFKSTLKYSTFINTLEFVSDLAYFIKGYCIEDIENMEWNDLYNTFSYDLKEYYCKRVEKSKNNPDKYAMKKDYMEYETNDINGLFGTFVETRRMQLSDNFIRGYRSNTSVFNQEFIDYFFSPLVSQYPVEQQLKQKIKRVKKRIKNSRNYLEKKQLQIELNSLNKEYKKEKQQLKRKSDNNSNISDN